MICKKFDQQIKKPEKPKFWTFEGFLKVKPKKVFFKPKNLGFFEAIFQPCLLATGTVTKMIRWPPNGAHRRSSESRILS